MKLIKESINEIKRNQETSGLSSIGIGKAAMNKAYKHIINNWPDTYEDSYDNLHDAIYYNYNTKVNKYPKIIKDVENLLNSPQKDILFAIMMKRKQDQKDILNNCFRLLERSIDFTKYMIQLTPLSYCTMRYSASLGMMSASIYAKTKGKAFSERKFTIFFIRKDPN